MPRGVAALSLSALLFAAPGRAAPQAVATATPPPPTFAQSVDVTETSILVLPRGRPLGAAGLQVLEDEKLRAVLRVEPVRRASAPPTRQVVVALDRSFCDDDASRPALLELAKSSSALLDDEGEVELVVDGSTRHVPHGGVPMLTDELARLAGHPGCARLPHRLLWDARDAVRTSTDPAAAAQAAIEQLREEARRDARAILGSLPECHADVCLLVLVHAGYPLDPLPWIASDTIAASTHVDSAGLREAARRFGATLAARHWITCPAAVTRRTSDGIASFLAVTGTPGMQALGAIARESGGTPWVNEGFLAPMLRRLDAAQRVWYRTEPFQPGELRAVAVRDVATGHDVDGPRWVGDASGAT